MRNQKMKTVTFAVAESVPDIANYYLTAGKPYMAHFEKCHKVLFDIVDDQGDAIFCDWTSCPHLHKRDWTRIEKQFPSTMRKHEIVWGQIVS